MFYDIYVELCKSINKKPSVVAAELHINKSNVSNWKNNGYTPRGEALQKIADYFGVTADYLLNGEQKEKPSAENGEELAFSDMELLAAYKSADEITQGLIRRALGL